jgi:hypothetical protein
MKDFYKKLFEILGESTKKLHSIAGPDDLDKCNLQTVLLSEVVFQLKDLNTNFEGIHDELWDYNQRRDED